MIEISDIVPFFEKKKSLNQKTLHRFLISEFKLKNILDFNILTEIKAEIKIEWCHVSIKMQKVISK